MLDYIPNEFSRGWLANDYANKDAVMVRLTYIDINDGNLYDALLFARIMFWHEPSRETGESRMRRKKDGHLWIAKNHADWWAECRINQRMARKCLERLRQHNLIVYQPHGENGNATPWIRVNWDEFEKRMKAWSWLKIQAIPPVL